MKLVSEDFATNNIHKVNINNNNNFLTYFIIDIAEMDNMFIHLTNVAI